MTGIVRFTLRMIQLNYKLEIIFWKDIFNPILVTFISIGQNIAGLFKIWLKKRSNELSGRHVKVKDFLQYMPIIDQQINENQSNSSQSALNLTNLR